MKQFRFLSLASGSSGNAYYVGTLTQGMIIDAGVSPRALKKGLLEAGISLQSVLGVCITHDHIDHVLYAGAYGEKLGLPVFSTELIHAGITKHSRSNIKIGASKRLIRKEDPFSVGEFKITAFEVPHDGSDNVGYVVRYGDQTLVMATDLGHIPERVAMHIAQANYLVLEANYDAEMLETGPYPYHLKQRIRQENGHLCNHVTAEFVAGHYTPALSHLFLCHLSQENNHPELALHTVCAALSGKGIRVGVDVQVHCLPRKRPSECYILRPGDALCSFDG